MESIQGYNLIDITIAAVILVAVILGLWKGFIRTLTALASLVFGVVLAFRYYPKMEPYLGKISSLDPQVSMVLSMVVVFLIVQVVFVIIRFILNALVDLTRLSWLDRVFGAAMGLVGGSLIVAVVVQVMLTGMPEWPVVKQSKLIGPASELTKKSMEYVPKEWRNQLDATLSKWKSEDKKPRKPAAVKKPTGTAGGNPFIPPREEGPTEARKPSQKTAGSDRPALPPIVAPRAPDSATQDNRSQPADTR